MTERRIAVVSRWLPTPDKPQANLFLREHVHALPTENVELIMPHLAIRRPSRQIWSVPSLPRAIHTVHVPFPSRLLTSATGCRLAARASSHIVGAEPRVDAVVVHCFAGAGVIASALASAHDAPLLYVEHWSAVANETLPKALAAELRFTISFADAVLPVSDNLGSVLENRWNAKVTRVVGNAFDPDAFVATPTPQTTQIAMIADFRTVKGHRLVVEAVQLLSEQLRSSGWRIIMVGDGPERQAIEDEVAKRSLSDILIFTGRLERAGVANLLKESRWSMLASESENRPLAVLESLAVGRPVLAPRVGGLVELINTDNGLLYDRTTEGLVSALRWVIAHPSGGHDWRLISQHVRTVHTVGALRNAYHDTLESQWTSRNP